MGIVHSSPNTPTFPTHSTLPNQSDSVPYIPDSPSLELESKRSIEKLDHQLDIRSGFLPRVPPLARLQLQPWCAWEQALDQAHGLQLGQGDDSSDSHTSLWRQFIRDKLPVLSVEGLSSSPPQLRRAHLVLAFLTHLYVHSDKLPDQHLHSHQSNPAFVPAALAEPLCAVSQLLDIAPVLTYSDTVLYNWALIDPRHGFTPDNVKILTTFTGTTDEEHFYKTSVLIETLGPMCLSLMRSSLDEALMADELSVSRISANLYLLASMIDQINLVLERVRQGCDPACFYWIVRPWMNGGPRQMGPHGPLMDWGGPSAGQSTLIHALDVFLGIDHRPRSDEQRSSSQDENTFMERMTSYMPHHHRRFLLHLASTLGPNSQSTVFPELPDQPTYSVRTLAAAAPPGSALHLAYNQAVNALLNMRASHSRIALLYVLSQTRVSPPPGSPFLVGWERTRQLQQASKIERGTGGTDLAQFLRRCRERTSEAIIPH